MVLSDLRLSVAPEDNSVAHHFAVPETGRESAGALLTLRFSDKETLKLDHFVPRALEQQRVAPGPMGLGSPAVKVELFNERFRVKEWLTQSDPSKAAEVNLGPAILSLERLWSLPMRQSFSRPAPPRL